MKDMRRKRRSKFVNLIHYFQNVFTIINPIIVNNDKIHINSPLQ